MLQRILPAPLLSAVLFVLWLALARSTTAGQVLLALLLATAVPILTRKLRPAARVHRPLAIARYIGNVGHDVVRSSFEVAWGVIVWKQRPARSQFVVIPLELRDSVGLAVLAMVTTVVPGTVWTELALDRSKLMLHVWDVADERAFVDHWKARYERPLREIFE